jgi:hypothetical protein
MSVATLFSSVHLATPIMDGDPPRGSTVIRTAALQINTNTLILGVCRGKVQEQGKHVPWSAVTLFRSFLELHHIHHTGRLDHLELRRNTLNTFYAFAIHSSSTGTDPNSMVNEMAGKARVQTRHELW